MSTVVAAKPLAAAAEHSRCACPGDLAVGRVQRAGNIGKRPVSLQLLLACFWVLGLTEIVGSHGGTSDQMRCECVFCDHILALYTWHAAKGAQPSGRCRTRAGALLAAPCGSGPPKNSAALSTAGCVPPITSLRRERCPPTVRPRLQVDLKAGERIQYKYVILEEQVRPRPLLLSTGSACQTVPVVG